MAALTAPADIRSRRGKQPQLRDVPLKSGYKVYAGAIVVIQQSTGYGRPAFDGTGCIAKGVAQKTLDNSSTGTDPGANTNGGLIMPVLSGGVFGPFANDTGTAVAITDRTKVCYLLDDNTITMDGTSRSVAGIVDDLTSEGVWVEIDPDGRQA
jgi:hypothetical protein